MRIRELIQGGLTAHDDHLIAVDDLVRFRERGAPRVLRARVSGGFDVEVLPERGLDIGAAWFGGEPVAWTTPVADPRPLRRPRGEQWRDRWGGGLVTTCGLDNIGPPRGDSGLHGSFSHTRAQQVSWQSLIDVDRASVVVRGRIPDRRRGVVASRELEVCVPANGAPFVEVRDSIANRGTNPVSIALLYHVNLGAPLVVPGTRVAIDAASTQAREPCAAVPDAAVLPSPTEHVTEAVFEHRGVAALGGRAEAIVTSPAGVTSVSVSWPVAELDRLYQWVLPTAGGWALGIEPANAPIFGPDRVGELAGARLLDPGATVSTSVRITARVAPGLTAGTTASTLRQRCSAKGGRWSGSRP